MDSKTEGKVLNAKRDRQQIKRWNCGEIKRGWSSEKSEKWTGIFFFLRMKGRDGVTRAMWSESLTTFSPLGATRSDKD